MNITWRKIAVSLVSLALLASTVVCRGQSALEQATSRAKLSSSGGTIGCVRGLAVTSLNNKIEFGKVFTITAKVTPGKGTVSVNASDVDEYFVESITKARKYVIKTIAAAGYKADFMKTNIDIHYQCDGPKGGDSAGAAMATAILSSLLQVPVRNEVVITGAIEPDGTVKPVGGVDLKANAAFRNPKILTIIIPRSSDNLSDVLSLNPKLLQGHRLIAAKDMHEVFRQAILGYDQNTLFMAAQTFTQGLALYDQGKTEDAILKLRQAMALTPEDMAIPVWIRQMQTNPKVAAPSEQ